MVSTSINLSKEAAIMEAAPDTNYQNYCTARVTASGDGGYGLMEFDISNMIDVPLDNIFTAMLSCDVGFISNIRLKDFRRIDDNTWDDSTITWNTWISGGHASTDYNIEATWTTEEWHSVDIKTMLKAALRDGHDYLGILIKFVDESADGDYHNIDFFSTSKLEIEYDTYSQTHDSPLICWYQDYYDGWGDKVEVASHNCPTGTQMLFNLTDPWGVLHSNVLLYTNGSNSVTYDNSGRHWKVQIIFFTCDSASCDHLAGYSIREWYFEDNCYVKTTGDNDRNGTSWTEAWATVDQAANEAFDGQEVHIGFGNYNAEPSNNEIAPVNTGSNGIKYTPETAGTGGGTGSVTVEKN